MHTNSPDGQTDSQSDRLQGNTAETEVMSLYRPLLAQYTCARAPTLNSVLIIAIHLICKPTLESMASFKLNMEGNLMRIKV